MQHAVITHYDEASYLHNEQGETERHEYVAGEVFAMAGATKRHGTLALNAAIHLRQHLRGKPYQVWMADMKVRVAVDSAYYYPDVVVTCNAHDLSADAPKDYVEAPHLIVEVLSESTESIDRREKWFSYRRLPSLQEYVLIDQNRAWVEVFRRTPAGWTQAIYVAGDTVQLLATDAVAEQAAAQLSQLNIEMSELYADVGL